MVAEVVDARKRPAMEQTMERMAMKHRSAQRPA
jgi:hypothetical protein